MRQLFVRDSHDGVAVVVQLRPPALSDTETHDGRQKQNDGGRDVGRRSQSRQQGGAPAEAVAARVCRSRVDRGCYSSCRPLLPLRKNRAAGGKPSVADIMAMARAKKGETADAPAPAKETPKPTPKPAAAKAAPAKKEAAAPAGPVDTQSILTAARKGAQARPDDQGRSRGEGRRRRAAAEEAAERNDRRAADAGQTGLREAAGRSNQRRKSPSGGHSCSACRRWRSASPR